MQAPGNLAREARSSMPEEAGRQHLRPPLSLLLSTTSTTATTTHLAGINLLVPPSSLV